MINYICETWRKLCWGRMKLVWEQLKQTNLEKSPLERGEARRSETAQEPPLCPATVTLRICQWLDLVKREVLHSKNAVVNFNFDQLFPICQLPCWVPTKKWDPLLNPGQGQLNIPQTLVSGKPEKISSLYLVSTQISFASNMTPHLPREQGINKAGKHYKTSLRRLVAFRFLTLLLELVCSVFFSVFFSSMSMTRDIFDHLNFQSFKSPPWSVRWKESKGAQPVVDGDNHHVFIHHHLWSETSAPVLNKFFFYFGFSSLGVLYSFLYSKFSYSCYLFLPVFSARAHFKASTMNLNSLKYLSSSSCVLSLDPI